ncbi:MAG: hypothetical protein ITG02_11725 [Patulibacter sp.]|nr:hypothetical protein [Patulibacter sp.]
MNPGTDLSEARRPVARILVPEEDINVPGPRRRPDDIDAPVGLIRFEALFVFLIGWLLFAAVGYRAVIDQHVVPADALDLMGRAFYVWHNDPAKLAAIGFSAPPLQTLGLLPFAIVKPLASSLIALPVASGFWGALALMLIHRTLARCGFTLGRRVLATVLIAVNPLWLFYASTGMPDMIYVAALAATVYFVFTWVIEDQPRFVAGVGLCLALLSIGRFGLILWAILLAIVVAVVLAVRKADDDESEGLLITLLAPTATVVFLWIMICWVIAGDPFGWIVDAQPFGGPSASNATQPVELGNLIKHTGAVLIGGSLITVLAFVGLIWGAATRRDAIAGGMAIVVLGGIAVLVGNAVIHDDMSLLSLRSVLPLTVFGIGAAAWLARSQGAIGATMAMVSLVLAIPAAGIAMDRYPYQNLEQAFLRGMIQQKDQEGTSSRGGYRVGIEDSQRMAAFIKATVGDRKNTVLADNSVVGGVILLTGRPEAFVDRVDEGDKYFLEVLDAPWGKVRYILTTTGSGSGANSINQRYPGITRGTVPGFSPLYRSGRYMLLSVAATNPRRTADEVSP